MHTNSLYRVIEAGLNFTTISNVVNVVQKKNKDFYIFELGVTQDIQVGKYKLSAHHISAYKDHEFGINSDSQYHYTAYFTDEQHHEYCLHAYYSSNDALIVKPLLSKKVGEQYEIINSDDLEVEFKHIANLYVRDWVSSVRNSQKQLIAKLKKEYEQCDAYSTALSIDFQQNKEAYLDSLDGQIKKLEEQMLYVNDPHPLKRTGQLLKDIMDSISNNVQTEDDLEIPVNEEPPHEPDDIIRFFSASAQKKSKVPQKKLTFPHELTKLQQAFEKLPVIDQELINALPELYREILTLQLYLHTYKTSYEEIKQLQSLTKQVESAGHKLLERVLLRNEFTAVRQLNVFHNNVSKSIINLALTQRPLLLDCLLEERILPSDFSNFTVSKQEYKSFLDYCFKNASNKTTNLFEVIIKHNPLLLLDRDANQLPYAATLLLQQENHVFWRVLEKHSAKTIENTAFLRRLNQIILQQSNQANCPKKICSQINKLVSENLQRIKKLEKKPMFDSLVQIARAKVQTKTKKKINGLVSRLENEKKKIDSMFADSIEELEKQIIQETEEIDRLENLFRIGSHNKNRRHTKDHQEAFNFNVRF
ncbi:hypothetical protein [Legionella rowbothamii]|uniref:hypothetical protein n=1 Tax=Legionella rowbothamii TaxID=96229 RepID=UPI0010557BEB|nr:hypothetical protein [Legionella rowbothamii]